jgi:hypothetical protein
MGGGNLAHQRRLYLYGMGCRRQHSRSSNSGTPDQAFRGSQKNNCLDFSRFLFFAFRRPIHNIRDSSLFQIIAMDSLLFSGLAAFHQSRMFLVYRVTG